MHFAAPFIDSGAFSKSSLGVICRCRTYRHQPLRKDTNTFRKKWPKGKKEFENSFLNPISDILQAHHCGTDHSEYARSKREDRDRLGDFFEISENDPAAGSPTATLLRLLPLLDCKYCPNSIQTQVAPCSNLQRALLTTHYRQRRAVCTRTRDVFAAF